jgi:heme-degrading monooxygenase HmoA
MPLDRERSNYGLDQQHGRSAAHHFVLRCARDTRTNLDSQRQETKKMFIAMNRFRVKKGSEQDFEKVWLNRDSHLDKVPGFVEFHLLKGPEHDDYTLYASHTIWQSRATFEAWTRSEEFRAAHRDAGQNKPLYLDHPQFEGFEVRQTVGRGKAAVA